MAAMLVEVKLVDLTLQAMADRPTRINAQAVWLLHGLMLLRELTYWQLVESPTWAHLCNLLDSSIPNENGLGNSSSNHLCDHEFVDALLSVTEEAFSQFANAEKTLRGQGRQKDREKTITEAKPLLRAFRPLCCAMLMVHLY